ncbi:GNAT family N-acetyltransferase [Jeotgalicoccus huakuii]|nr:GNAT family N-acetyltransferase [Jeotgalicoccus huakuii]
MALRLAVMSDVPHIMDIVSRVIPEMHAVGNYQWDENYPNASVFQDDVKAESLYVFEEDGVIKGCITADDNHAFSYDDIPWELARIDCLATHRLAIDPNFQGQGLAQKIIREIIEVGKQKGYLGIHTDTSLENKAMQYLFTKLGFEFKGNLNLDDNLDDWYVAYEIVF